MNNYTAYISAIKPYRDESARLRQYQRVKDKLLPLYPTEQHDEITRAICRRLKI